MSEGIFLEAYNYAMNELHNEYKARGEENTFLFNFNVNYYGDDGKTLTVSVGNAFMKNQVTSKGILKIIEDKIREITCLDNLTVECVINNEQKPKSIDENSTVKTDSNSSEKSESSENSKIEEPKSEEKIKSLLNSIQKDLENDADIKPANEQKHHPKLRADFIFDNFIPGENCIFAYNAALSVAREPGTNKNPILFYGGSGLGKTHLMQSIGNYIYNQNPKAKICYISAESFTNEFTDSIKTKKTTEFKNKYRNLDVLLLDDIHFLEGKEQTQEELFYTFNALFDNKKQLVFTCDRPIREIRFMAERLVSRLSNGLCIDIQAPKYENRYAILQKKIDLRGKKLDSEIIDYIAQNIETNVRDLEAALNTLISYSELVEENLTLEMAKNQLQRIISSTVENISLEVIEKVIAESNQISVSDLKGTKKDKKYAVPRQYAQYIARELTEISYTELGREFRKDHSTIMHNCQKIEELVKTDSTIEQLIRLYIKKIKEYKK